MKEKNINPTLLELLIGNLLYGIIGMALIIFLTEDRLKLLAGFIIGIILACLCAWSMHHTLESAYGLHEHEALKKMGKAYAIRLAVLIAALAILYVFKIGDLLAMIVGIFSLKISAYAQPLTHKLISGKFIKKEKR